MENHQNFNRMNYLKYNIQNNNNTIRNHRTYNNFITQRNKKDSLSNTNNRNENNLLLARNLNTSKPNNENSMNNISKINKNNNEIRRGSHTIFVRDETKFPEEKNTYNRAYNNNYNQNISNYNNYTLNNINQNNYRRKSKESLVNIENNKNTEKANNNKNYINSNYAQITHNKYKVIEKNIDNNHTKNKQKEEETLIDIVNKQKGITNIGNTCFINSSLQIFIHCPLFINKLITKINLINNKTTPIISNFISICDLMLKTKRNYISIHDFKNILGLNHKIFSGAFQQDSQEFIRIFLEDISRELNEIKYNGIYRLLSNSDSKTKKMRDEDFHLNFIQREKSIIIDIFYSQLVNIYTCQCNSTIYSFQKILDFPLLFPQNLKSNIISLKELLKFHFSIEYIDFETKCNNCQKKSKHKKELKISRPPEILILSLQRIDLINEKKLDYKVKFSQKLDIYEFIDKDCGYNKESKYDLFGIINHEGNIDSGHYYSFIKNENKKWIEFNDANVGEINYFNDCSDTVYALFYIKEKYNI